ncbi:hypothetical protein P3S68_003690 [Capsicum galapagoense]
MHPNMEWLFPFQRTLLESNANSLCSQDPNAISSGTAVSPTKLISQPEHKKNDEQTEVPWVLVYTTCLLFLAVLGIVGALNIIFYFGSSKNGH